MKLRITKKHIKNSKRQSQESCMIAEALKDIGYEKPVVSGHGIRPEYYNPEKFIPEKSLRYVIRAYDNGQKIEPFIIEIKNKIAKLIGKDYKEIVDQGA